MRGVGRTVRGERTNGDQDMPRVTLREDECACVPTSEELVRVAFRDHESLYLILRADNGEH